MKRTISAILTLSLGVAPLAAAQHAYILGAPNGLVQRWSYASAQQTAKVDFSTVKPVDLIPNVPCKLMVIQSQKDVFVTPAHQHLIDHAVEERRKANLPTTAWTIEDAHHIAGMYVDPDAYMQRVADFLAS